MRRVFDGGSHPISKYEAEQHLTQMLNEANLEIDLDSVKIERFENDSPNDTTATVDPDPLVARGRVSFYYRALDDRMQKTSKAFRIRQLTLGERQVAISDHSYILN